MARLITLLGMVSRNLEGLVLQDSWDNMDVDTGPTLDKRLMDLKIGNTVFKSLTYLKVDRSSVTTLLALFNLLSMMPNLAAMDMELPDYDTGEEVVNHWNQEEYPAPIVTRLKSLRVICPLRSEIGRQSAGRAMLFSLIESFVNLERVHMILRPAVFDEYHLYLF